MMVLNWSLWVKPQLRETPAKLWGHQRKMIDPINNSI